MFFAIICSKIKLQASGNCGTDISWTFESNILTISGTGEMDSAILLPWSGYLSQTTKIVITTGVTSIRDFAFKGSTVAVAELPDTLLSIQTCAFEDCASLTRITIPNSVTTIEYSAFQNCAALEEVILGTALNEVGSYAFSECPLLQSFTIENNADFCTLDGVLYNKAQTILIVFPGAKTSITFPSTITKIEQDAFFGCVGLTTITIPNTMTTLTGKSIRGLPNLESIKIPKSVTSIEAAAFYDCPKLKTLEYCGNQNPGDDTSFDGTPLLTRVIINTPPPHFRNKPDTPTFLSNLKDLLIV